MTPIYLDAQATTPVDERVLASMLPYFSEKFGNAASKTHAFGWTADSAVERSREVIAGVIGATPRDIVFTSGATESNNLAIKGVVENALATYALSSPPPMQHASAIGAPREYRPLHVVTTAIEHHAVLDVVRSLEHHGVAVTVVPPDADGIVHADAIAAALTDRTVLVSVMLANNEVGTLQPVAEIGAVTRARGILLHTDAAQAIGRVPIDVDAMNVDLLSLSAHKLYGPKGVGVLYARSNRPRVRLSPQMEGGGHERGVRSGTLNVPGIVGLARACEILQQEGDTENARFRALRDRLLAALTAALPGVHLNGHATRRLAGNLNVSFDGISSDALVGSLREVAVSTGSACTSASLEPSYVLRAMGLSDARARASVRFGIGRFTTEEEIDRAVLHVVERVNALRAPPSV
jgi:cysteine desulfurase